MRKNSAKPGTPGLLRALALLLLASFPTVNAAAGLFNWGTDRMKDANEEVRGNLEKILKSVKSDGRTYPSPRDFSEIVYTSAKSIEAKNRFVVSGGDLRVEFAEGSIIVADGDVEIDRAEDSVIIAGGKIRSRWTSSVILNSLILSDSRVVFEGLLEDCTLYAKNGAKLSSVKNLAVFPSVALEIGSREGDIRTIEAKPPF